MYNSENNVKDLPITIDSFDETFFEILTKHRYGQSLSDEEHQIYLQKYNAMKPYFEYASNKFVSRLNPPEVQGSQLIYSTTVNNIMDF